MTPADQVPLKSGAHFPRLGATRHRSRADAVLSRGRTFVATPGTRGQGDCEPSRDASWFCPANFKRRSPWFVTRLFPALRHLLRRMPRGGDFGRCTHSPVFLCCPVLSIAELPHHTCMRTTSNDFACNRRRRWIRRRSSASISKKRR